jgi:hypothetical protein
MIALLLIVLLVVAVVAIVLRGRTGAAEERDVSGLRRFLLYLFLLIALFSGASGVTRVCAALLPIGRRLVDTGPEELALGLSLTVVAIPVWALLWQAVHRRLMRDPDERASLQWSLYLAIATTTALIVALTNLLAVGSWAVGASELDAPSVAAAVVWTTVWGAHLALCLRPTLAPTRTQPTLVVLAGSAVGIVALGLGVDGVVSFGFNQAYRAIANTTLIDTPTTSDLRHSLVLTVLAAAVWWWHWLRRALHGPRSVAWHVYVLLVPVLGGLLVAVGSAATALFTLMQWVIGDPEATRAVVQLSVIPEAVAAMAVGSWVWWYHLTVVGPVAPDQRGEAERIYEYVVAAVGLVAAAVGVATAIVAAIRAVTPARLAATDPVGHDTMALATTLVVIGVPLWWAFWRRVQHRVRSGDVAELQSSARRSYVFTVLSVAGLTAAVSVVAILFVVRDLLEGSLDAAVVDDLRVAIALVITAGAVAAYHWTVHNEDRAAWPEPEPRPARHVLLVSSNGQALADAVAQRTGATVRSLQRLDATPGQEPDADAVIDAIVTSPHERLLITVDQDGAFHAIPYEAPRSVTRGGPA